MIVSVNLSPGKFVPSYERGDAEALPEKARAVYERYCMATHYREQWISALDGALQASGVLKVAGDGQPRYCCMGVAAETHMRELGLTYLHDSNDEVFTRDDEVQFVAALDQQSLDLYALSDAQQSVLMSLNDNGAPFRAIGAGIRSMEYFIDGKYYRPFLSALWFADCEAREAAGWKSSVSGS